MTRLPTITAAQMVAALKRAGFQPQRQIGSHLYLNDPVRDIVTSVPMHAKDLGRGLMKAILKQAQLSEDEFRKLL